MGDLPVFVVALSDSVRWESVSEQCARYGLTPQRVDAVDFRHVEQDAAAQYYLPTEQALRKNRLLKPAEIGCAMSHRKIYRRMVEENIPHALVLEDDVRFLLPPQEILANLGTIGAQVAFDVLILGYVKVLSAQLPYYYRRIPIKTLAAFGAYRLGIPWEQYGCGTVAYVVSCEGARKMLAQGDKVRVTADDWPYFEKQCGLSVLHVRPSVALEACDVFDSSVRTEKANYLKPTWHSVMIRSLKGWLKNFAMNVLGMKRKP